ncbi:MAG: outer membrane protein assembly factor BamA [Flavobacteriales bacterium]|nr:outer membrane protein assembly factor BamA [Flavobacteriales bacterium]
MKKQIIFFLISICSTISFSQSNDYNNIYKIGGIIVDGNKNIDHNSIIKFSDLKIGENVNLDEDLGISIKKLWDQKLFSNVNIQKEKQENNLIFLKITVEENPKLSKFNFYGIKKSEEDQLRELLQLTKGQSLSKSDLEIIKQKTSDFLKDKRFFNAEIDIIDNIEESNYMYLSIKINKKEKVKINSIKFSGNNFLNENQLKRVMKNTKESKLLRVFKPSKILEENLKEDLALIENKYFENGFLDFKIEKQDIKKHEGDDVDVYININEGEQYYFGDIKFVGNTIYSNKQLFKIINFKKNEVFNRTKLEQKLYGSPDGNDIHSLYLDNGYLFSQVQSNEILNGIDKIDIIINILEGKQAKINNVTVSGNTKTNDKVILREIRTKPGDLFSRSMIMRSQREIAQLNYFDNEKLDVDIQPNNENGTVDVNYIVEEKHTDQIELQGGWGAGRVIGTLGVSFNNFSTKNIKDKSTWSPLPSGDGQKFSIRASSNGAYFQQYAISFTEPWFGGKKPNSLSSSLSHSVQTNGLESDDPNRETIKITGINIGLNKRLKWPDDYFGLYQSINLQNFDLTNSTSSFTLNNGKSYNYSYNIILSRNSVDQPTFPRRGSNFSLSVQMTPPYSLLNPKDNYSELSDEEKFKWVEYHKWKFGANWFNSFSDKLVLKTNLEYGLIGMYNKEIGLSPFERFYVGGDGLYGMNLDGRDIIALRGYSNGSLTPSTGATIYNKYTLELRYGLSLSAQSPIYILGFLEAGNAWEEFDKFNPFNIKRSAGLGVRISIPMMGIMGVDWGYGFDPITGQPDANRGQFHFSINQLF